jgi:hypothetical protein
MDPRQLIALLALALVLGTLVYFLPTIVAYRRGHFRRGTILFLNIFIGWSGLGWVCILVWSATGQAYK